MKGKIDHTKGNRKKKRKATHTTEQESENTQCKKCGRVYEKNGAEAWIECDYCEKWFHVLCTNLPVLDGLDDKVDFTGEHCVNEAIQVTF